MTIFQLVLDQVLLILKQFSWSYAKKSGVRVLLKHGVDRDGLDVLNETKRWYWLGEMLYDIGNWRN